MDWMPNFGRRNLKIVVLECLKFNRGHRTSSNACSTTTSVQNPTKLKNVIPSKFSGQTGSARRIHEYRLIERQGLDCRHPQDSYNLVEKAGGSRR
jgi:hypothetical protein